MKRLNPYQNPPIRPDALIRFGDLECKQPTDMEQLTLFANQITLDVLQVCVMEWGEPEIKNVIDVNWEKREVKLQTPGFYGSYWTSFDKCLSQAAIDWYYIREAAAEANRLQIKLTIMESSTIPN